jgi:hypothetical protein
MIKWCKINVHWPMGQSSTGGVRTAHIRFDNDATSGSNTATIYGHTTTGCEKGEATPSILIASASEEEMTRSPEQVTEVKP